MIEFAKAVKHKRKLEAEKAKLSDSVEELKLAKIEILKNEHRVYNEKGQLSVRDMPKVFDEPYYKSNKLEKVYEPFVKKAKMLGCKWLVTSLSGKVFCSLERPVLDMAEPIPHFPYFSSFCLRIGETSSLKDLSISDSIYEISGNNFEWIENDFDFTKSSRFEVGLIGRKLEIMFRTGTTVIVQKNDLTGLRWSNENFFSDIIKYRFIEE